jgi:hypothetical protein
MKVYAAINKVQADLCKDGIGKDRKNQQQGYSFRGIDDMYNAIAPLLARHGLCILPRVTSRDVTERASKNGGVLFYVTVAMEFDFVAAEDASKHTVVMYGEAMDSGDKATNKAMSAAYKYACMQAFSIPTEGDNDADAHTHEVKPAKVEPKPAPKMISPPTATEHYTVSIERAEAIFEAAAASVDHFKLGNLDAAYDEVSGITDNGEKLFLWAVIKEFSALRSAIKTRWQNGQSA